MRTVVIAAVTAAGVAAAAGLLRAGPLSPDAGPVGPTYKTLGEIEPRVAIGPATTPGDSESLYVIAQPGSYYLTGPVQGVGGKYGIKITAAGPVTIDLGGFPLDGSVAAGETPTLDGIRAANAQTRLSIRDGVIRKWGGGGLRAQFGGAIVENLRVDGNEGIGLYVGQESVVSGCAAYDNALGGMNIGTATSISRCTAVNNGAYGVNGSIGVVMESCTAFFNVGDGIVVSGHSVVTRCASNNNGQDGFQLGANCRISDCIANVNSFAGIRATIGGNDIQGNTVQGNGMGIDLDQGGNFVARNTARGNTTNYNMPGSQTVGPVITATGTITTTNPWANFSH